MRRYASAAFFVLCVAVSVAAAINVFADDTDLQKQAGKVACTGVPCPSEPLVMRIDRTPIAHTYVFATGKSNVIVRCARAAILVGDYACAKE